MLLSGEKVADGHVLVIEDEFQVFLEDNLTDEQIRSVGDFLFSWEFVRKVTPVTRQEHPITLENLYKPTFSHYMVETTKLKDLFEMENRCHYLSSSHNVSKVNPSKKLLRYHQLPLELRDPLSPEERWGGTRVKEGHE